jgi:tRNA(adenine34) deaminase
MEDLYWMQQALQAAKEAAEAGEVPVGAACVRDGELLACEGNAPIGQCDPTAHAEVRVLRMAAEKVGNYRLPGVTLYVTLEPCAMCVGAMIHARIERVVFAASDSRTGSVVSVRQLLDEPTHNHRIQYAGGLCAEESAELLRAFFRQRRA